MLYKSACLTFGLSPSAGLFTKALKRVIAFLRSIGICLVIFLDDILIMADPPERAAEHTEVVISRLHDKEKEVNLETNPDYPICRFHCKLHKDAPSIVRRETAKLKSSALSLLENVPKAREIF